jgi:hypothetical protein
MRPATCRRSCACAGSWAEVATRAAGWARTVAYLGAWLGCTALILVTMVVWRGALLDAATAAARAMRVRGASALDLAWVIEFIDRAGLLVLGTLGLGLSVAIEYRFRQATQRGEFARWLVRVLLITGGVAAAGLLVQVLV